MVSHLEAADHDDHDESEEDCEARLKACSLSRHRRKRQQIVLPIGSCTQI